MLSYRKKNPPHVRGDARMTLLLNLLPGLDVTFLGGVRKEEDEDGKENV